MVHSVLSCGLGNWLFQYAVGKKLSLKNDCPLELDLYNFVSFKDINASKVVRELKKFNISDKLSRPVLGKSMKLLGLVREYPRNSNLVFNEKKWGFDSDVLALPRQVYLRGFFQSEKYFKDIEHVIREDLRFTYQPSDKDSLNIENHIKSVNSVSVHIRRGDYLKSHSHNVCSVKYYLDAVAYARKALDSAVFFIFSDDIEWCIANLKFNKAHYVDLKESKMNSVNDMRLMSLCKHNIIPNSTYSWWAAWLNSNKQKKVIAPDKWFNNPNNNKAMQDTLPEDWIRISL